MIIPAICTHSSEPRAALSRLFRRTSKSVLDVGCGTGTWLRATAELGVRDIFGVDGIIAKADELEIARDLISQVDLTSSFSLGRRFDVAFCLEVAARLEQVERGSAPRPDTSE